MWYWRLYTAGMGDFLKTVEAMRGGVVEDGWGECTLVGGQDFGQVEGKAVIDLALGNARVGAMAMSSDTLMVWLSAGKPLTAAAVVLLAQEGFVSFEDSVERFLPEFVRGDSAKSAITIRHLLTHT